MTIVASFSRKADKVLLNIFDVWKPRVNCYEKLPEIIVNTIVDCVSVRRNICGNGNGRYEINVPGATYWCDEVEYLDGIVVTRKIGEGESLDTVRITRDLGGVLG